MRTEPSFTRPNLTRIWQRPLEEWTFAAAWQFGAALARKWLSAAQGPRGFARKEAGVCALAGFLLTSLVWPVGVLAKSGEKTGDELRVSEPIVYKGICGASAAAAVSSDLFIVADDEANQLRVYRRDAGGPAIQVVDLAPQLELDRYAPEADIEGAARIGDRVYWITSHSRNNTGREHRNRYRFFATNLRTTNGSVAVTFVGKPYRDLLRDLATNPALRSLNLRAASELPPKASGGLNIEGLCATPEGKLLIGFRNPIPGGKALLVPLENAEALLQGRPALFGAPLQLDLGGLGIRDMGFWHDRYLIVAGPHDGGGKSKLYSWAGGTTAPKHLKDIDLKGLNPEAIIIYPDKGFDAVQLLSDDSGHQLGGKECKDLAPNARQFRSVWVLPEFKHHKGRASARSIP